MKRMLETLAAAALLMLLWYILPGQAFAAEQVNLTMEMDKQDYIHRENVTVTIQNDAQLTNQGVGITLYFNEEILDFDRQNSTVRMVAHRGVSGLETENTCAAFVAASI